MIKRIPLVASQTALVSTLTAYLTTSVYNKVPSDAVTPYIKVGAFTCKPDGSKDIDISDITSQIHVFSDYDGELEVNGIADDIIKVIGAVKLDLSVNDFKVMSQGYDMFESFEDDEYGYHGIVTFVARVQNLKM